MPQPRTSGSRLSRAEPILVAGLAALALAALAIRFTAVAQPLGIDQSLWASAARGMSRGQLLYRDVWEQRPPGIYFIYVAGFELFGWSASTVALMDALAAVLTTACIAAVGRALGGRVTAAVSAALYATLTMPAWLYGHGGFLERSVCETFIVLAAAFGAWCATKFRQRASLWYAFALGLSAGVAIVLKPNAGIYFPALVAWMWLSGREHQRSMAALRLPLAVSLVGAVLVPALTLAWLWRLGLIADARTAVLDFNRYYVSQGFALRGYSVAFSKAVWLRMKTDPLWLAGCAGAVAAVWEAARKRRLSPLAGLGLLWGAASVVALVVNGARLFNSYFIQALAPLALMATWLLVEFRRGTRARGVVVAVTCLLMVTMLIVGHYPARVLGTMQADVDVLRGRLDRTTYLERFGGYDNARGYSARANDELASYVREHTSADERVFLFGINGAGLYFTSDRLTAHRFLRVNFFVASDFPDPRFRLDAVIRELTASAPRYLIFERLHGTSDMGKAVDALLQEPAMSGILTSYRFDKQIEDFTLFRRLDPAR